MAELQPARLRLKEQLRGAVAAGHALGDAQCTLAPRGILPRSMPGRLGDAEDHHAAYKAKMRWAEQQVERARAKALTEQRTTASGLNELATGRPVSAGVPSELEAQCMHRGTHP